MGLPELGLEAVEGRIADNNTLGDVQNHLFFSLILSILVWLKRSPHGYQFTIASEIQGLIHTESILSLQVARLVVINSHDLLKFKTLLGLATWDLKDRPSRGGSTGIGGLTHLIDAWHKMYISTNVAFTVLPFERPSVILRKRSTFFHLKKPIMRQVVIDQVMTLSAYIQLSQLSAILVIRQKYHLEVVLAVDEEIRSIHFLTLLRI